MDPFELAQFITHTIRRQVAEANTVTRYREPIVGFVAADDPRFPSLRRFAGVAHMMPDDLLPGARSVVSFFLPFERRVVEANARHREQVAFEWAKAYVETNTLISQITARLVNPLAERGVRAAAEPATHNFDQKTLVSRWSHKSVAALAGIGSFGLHHLLITDQGCAGRLGSVVIDATLPISVVEPKERCLYFHDSSCLECVMRCPVDALEENGEIDKHRCWNRLLKVAQGYKHLGLAEMCGKCAIGPCSFESAV